MKYVASSHNLWHRMTLSLEEMAIDLPSTSNIMNYCQFNNNSNSNLNNVFFFFKESKSVLISVRF